MTVVEGERVHFGMFSTMVFNESKGRKLDADALARIADGMDFQGQSDFWRSTNTLCSSVLALRGSESKPLVKPRAYMSHIGVGQLSVFCPQTEDKMKENVTGGEAGFLWFRRT
ncbi:MAG: hypothetical protein ACRD3H_04775 [Terriglobales bacterium]